MHFANNKAMARLARQVWCCICHTISILPAVQLKGTSKPTYQATNPYYTVESSISDMKKISEKKPIMHLCKYPLSTLPSAKRATM